jgi:predicted Zn-dependent peptidase
VFSFLSSFRDAGYLGIYVGTALDWVDDVIGVIAAELRTVAREGLRADELARVKNQLKGNMLLGLETSDSRMSRVAKNEVYFRRDFPLAEVASRVDATTNEEIIALADRLVRPEATGVAVLGALDGHRIDESVFAG